MADNTTYRHTCEDENGEPVLGEPCAACDIKKLQKIVQAVQVLGKPEWVAWANDMIPICPRWRIMRETRDDGLSWEDYIKTWGGYASAFIKLVAADAIDIPKHEDSIQGD